MSEDYKKAEETYATADARRFLALALILSTDPNAKKLLSDALLLASTPKEKVKQGKGKVKVKKK